MFSSYIWTYVLLKINCCLLDIDDRQNVSSLESCWTKWKEWGERKNLAPADISS